MHKHFDMAKFAKQVRSKCDSCENTRASSGKDKVAICGYHGWHDWYLSANLKSKNKKGVLKDHLLEGLSTEGVPKGLKNTVFPFKYNDFESLKDMFPELDRRN